MRTALITGAAGGIGAAIARRLAADGYVTALHCCTHLDRAQALARELGGMAVQADLADLAEISAMADRVLADLGHVDVLVNNAGIAMSGLFTDISPADRRRLFDVCIVNISSMWGQVGASCEVDYSTAKAALIGFTKALAQEVAPSGIRVNAIAPGVIRTPMLDVYSEDDLAALADETPLGRLGTPEDIAGAAAFLCSADAAFVTGQVLGVNGGFVI